MREIISEIVVIASILGGTASPLKGFHDIVRRAALEKAAQGLPSLEGMSRALREPRPSLKRPNRGARPGVDGNLKRESPKMVFTTTTINKNFMCCQ
jgi:hypothetical protein